MDKNLYYNFHIIHEPVTRNNIPGNCTIASISHSANV